jgi:hypothetical protein
LWCAAAALGVLSGCATLATQLPNESGWTERRIEKRPVRGIFGEQFVLGDYSLVYRGSETKTEVGWISEAATDIRNYAFYRGGTLLNRAALATFERTTSFGGASKGQILTFDVPLLNGVSITSDIKKTIRIQMDEHTAMDFVISTARGEPYVTFKDPALGDVSFSRYESRNKNTPTSEYTYFTGFTCSVGGRDYGILAFYPSALFVESGVEADLDAENIALYVLSAYVSFVYQH